MTDAPLTRDRAKARLNDCFEDGAGIYSRHFREELANDNLTTEDVLTVCKSGAIIMAPEKDLKTGNWKYRIEGITADDDYVAVVFAFTRNLTVLITVFRKRGYE